MNFSATPAGKSHARQRRFWCTGCLVALVALSGMLATAQDASTGDAHQGGYRPDNVYAYPAKLSLDLRRVAVLPLSPATGSSDLAAGCEAMAPVLLEQLVKTKRFEAVPVDAGTLRSATGRTQWTGGETLPADFLGYFRREYDCDAVLFAELTSYRAYAPMAVGWRLKLADARSGRILWAADELFDAALPEIYKSSQKFAGQPVKWHLCRQENWLAANSPRQFGCYSAAALLETLPDR